MSKRNVGQPIQQLDPFAIQVSQPTIAIPSLPATKEALKLPEVSGLKEIK